MNNRVLCTTEKSVRQSPEYEWSDMCRSKGYLEPEKVETTVGLYMAVETGCNIWAG